MKATPNSVYHAAQLRKSELMPSLLNEMARITQGTGFSLEPQSSFFVDINLPGDTSDLDVAIVGLHTQADFDQALALVKRAGLSDTLTIKTLSVRPGYIVQYTAPAGFPVDLQIRRQKEIDLMMPCWRKIKNASDGVKRAIVWNKWIRKEDIKQYKAYKAKIYSWAGFPTNWNEVP